MPRQTRRQPRRRAQPEILPNDVRMVSVAPGASPGVRVTYQCDSLEQAMRVIQRTAAQHETFDANYNRETGELVLVIW